jgi:UDP:flavonoid glycosyltransferase YjiC (YdhE family)
MARGGGGRLDALPSLPGSPLVVEVAPPLELLPRAALTITHADLNTVLEALSCGGPMVAIPIANDQSGVAARLAWSGCSAVVPLKQVSVSRLRPAIDRDWSDPSYRGNAHRLQQAITTGMPVP